MSSLNANTEKQRTKRALLPSVKEEQLEAKGPAALQDLSITRDPEIILTEAQRAAQALKGILSKKTRPITFNGEQYLEFEDWQTLAEFYGITAKGVETKYVEFGSVKGFEARAVAIRVSDGQELSGAEAMCLNDERNWNHKPLFQLKSMAQTRACAKALRNILAWVVVLAGYKPTPAEEMISVIESASPSAQASQASQAPSILASEESEDLIARFLKVNEGYSKIYGAEGYKVFLHNSKGESPTLERIKAFSTPKQIAWLRSAVEAMEDQLQGQIH